MSASDMPRGSEVRSANVQPLEMEAEFPVNPRAVFTEVHRVGNPGNSRNWELGLTTLNYGMKAAVIENNSTCTDGARLTRMTGLWRVLRRKTGFR